MSESNEILTMRAMAWERAKGELESYLQTYWPEYAPNGDMVDNGFEEASAEINSFIRSFEYSCR